jgi:1-deoxy-D-xylulose-5-phosphate reductoisomerase
LARQVATQGGTAPAIFNAANEIAVAAFISGKIRFTGIAELVGQTLAACPSGEPNSLADVLAADAEARVIASRLALKLSH